MSKFHFIFSCPDKMDQGQMDHGKMDHRPKLDKMDHVNLCFYIILILVFAKIVFPGPNFGFSTRAGPDPAGFSRINPVRF